MKIKKAENSRAVCSAIVFALTILSIVILVSEVFVVYAVNPTEAERQAAWGLLGISALSSAFFGVVLYGGTFFGAGHSYALLERGKVIKSFFSKRDSFKICWQNWVCLDAVCYETDRFRLVIDCRMARRVPSLSEVSAYASVSEIESLMTSIGASIVEAVFIKTEVGAKTEAEEIAEAIRHFEGSAA